MRWDLEGNWGNLKDSILGKSKEPQKFQNTNELEKNETELEEWQKYEMIPRREFGKIQRLDLCHYISQGK